jgi:hypothetical protein
MTEETSTYREPTEEELRSTNPSTPTKLDRRIVVSCPTGVVLEGKIVFEDGEPLMNVLRAVIALEAPVTRGPDGTESGGIAKIFVTTFNNEIGKVVYWTAEALLKPIPMLVTIQNK